jgi:hypothetical protein
MATEVAIEPQYVCGAAALAGTWAQQSRQHTTPTADGAGARKAEKKANNRSQGKFVP